MQPTIDSLQKVRVPNNTHITNGNQRDGKIYRYCLQLFVNTTLKKIRFNSCPSCGSNKFEDAHYSVGAYKGSKFAKEYKRCCECFQTVGIHQRAPSKKQLKFILIIIKELGVLAVRHDIAYIRNCSAERQTLSSSG